MRPKLIPRRINWNFAIFPILLFIVAAALINLKRADWYSGDFYHQRQIIWYLLAGIVAVVTALTDFRVFERVAWPFYIFVNLLLIATLLFGKEVNHSIRWLELFGMTVQPSEYAKIALILLLGKELREAHRGEFHTITSLWKIFLYILMPCLLVILEPDLGTAILIGLVGFSMVLYEGLKFRSVLVLLAALAFVFPVAWQFDLIHDYQKNRFRLWMNPEQFKWDPEAKQILDKNMQPEQAVWAIGAGGFLGKGPHQGSKARLKYLPEMQTDFVITVYSEENGFVGCASLVLALLSLFAWGLYVARQARDRFGVLVAAGVTSYFAWQSFMNIGMVSGLLPVVGITLPFFSYGGSSLLSVMIGVGLLCNIAFFKGRA